MHKIAQVRHLRHEIAAKVTFYFQRDLSDNVWHVEAARDYLPPAPKIFPSDTECFVFWYPVGLPYRYTTTTGSSVVG